MSKLSKSTDQEREIESADSDAGLPQKQPSRNLTAILFAALVLWILSIAWGTILFGKVDDWRKPLLVMLPMGLFLGVWGLLLWRKYRPAGK